MTGGNDAQRRAGFSVESGGLALVVDGGPRAGRRGASPALAHDDDPRHGAFDDRALALLNATLGLPWHAPALEVLAGPLRLRALTPLVVAGCDGGSFVAGGLGRAPWSGIVVDEGAAITIGAAVGLRRTIAVRALDGATIAAAPGTPLLRGDVVELVDRGRRVDEDEAGAALAAPPSNAERATPPGAGVDGGAPCVRVVAGPERALFGDEAWDTLLSTSWMVAPTSSRQGIRLTTPTRTTTLPAPSAELVTTGVWTGAVQVPPSGLPIVLGPDSRTTGGYPRLAHVIAVDRFRLAHARPGRALRFVAVDLDEARALHRAFSRRFRPAAPPTPAAR